MQDSAHILIPLGAVLLASLALDALGRRTKLPRVTLLILFGFLVGPGGLGWIPAAVERWYPLIADMALGMIGFLLGGHLTRLRLRRMGALAAWVSLVHVALTYLVVAVGLSIAGVALPLALILAAIATATDPAATEDVIQETGASGDFTEMLRGVVAIDDAWGLILFSFTLVAAQILQGGGDGLSFLLKGAWDVSGALLLGVGLGLPVALVTGRLHGNKPVMIEALGAVFLCVGVAHWMNVSYLLASVTLGVTVANFARHHARPFHAIEGIDRPFIIVFFVLSGAMLAWQDLQAVGWIGVAYVLLRSTGRLAGGPVAAQPAWAGTAAVRWSGLALLPQAGVALAMAVVAVHAFPSFAVVLPIVIASTVFFELLGPICTRITLKHLGEIT